MFLSTVQNNNFVQQLAVQNSNFVRLNYMKKKRWYPTLNRCRSRVVLQHVTGTPEAWTYYFPRVYHTYTQYRSTTNINMNTPTSPVDKLPAELQHQSTYQYRKTHMSQLLNFEQILATAEDRRCTVDTDLEDLLVLVEQKRAEQSALENKISMVRNNIRHVKKVLDTLPEQTCAGKLEDPHTKLLLPVKEIVGEETIADQDLVSVIFEGTDDCNRWIPLNDIRSDETISNMYDEWKTWQQKYTEKFPEGSILSHVEDFKKALKNGWQPESISNTLLPVYQLLDNGAKEHFRSIVNCCEGSNDVFYAVVRDEYDTRKKIPLYALEKCNLSIELWDTWFQMYNNLEQLGCPLDEAKDYSYTDLVNQYYALAAPSSAENTPVNSPVKKRPRRS